MPLRKGLLGLLLLFGASRADAAVVEALSIDQILSRSDVACVVRVVATAARWQGESIVTDVHAVCERALFGAATGDTIGFFTEGGMVDGVGMRVPGEPTFRPGDRALVFLSAAAGNLRVTGMAQGVLRVDGPVGHETVRPNDARMDLVRRTEHGLAPAQPWLTRAKSLTEVVADVLRRRDATR